MEKEGSDTTIDAHKEVEPDLEDEKWFDLRDSLQQDGGLAPRRRSAKYRRNYLTPWLNVETLKSNPQMLIALLHVRTAYKISDWAAWDLKQFTSSRMAGYFDCKFSPLTINISNENDYGLTTKWKEGPTHRGDAVGFPAGLLLLEAQANILRFLHHLAL